MCDCQESRHQSFIKQHPPHTVRTKRRAYSCLEWTETVLFGRWRRAGTDTAWAIGLGGLENSARHNKGVKEDI